MALGPQPDLTGFLSFIRNVMGISTAQLPDNAPVIPMALSVALAVVNPALNCAGYGGGIAGTDAVNIYTLAVYNLAGDNLVNYAPDQTSSTFFADLRKDFNCNAFVSGVVQSTSDESTSASLVVMEAAKEFTLANLQNLKTPWGRQYLAFAQSYGQIVGLT